VAFEFPTIEAIGGFLADQLGLDGSSETAAEVPEKELSNGHSDVLERIRMMSDDEVERQFAQKVSEGKSIS
jgi:hypothetical protein